MPKSREEILTDVRAQLAKLSAEQMVDLCLGNSSANDNFTEALSATAALGQVCYQLAGEDSAKMFICLSLRYLACREASASKPQFELDTSRLEDLGK